jgi:hypothetical protein
MGVEEQKEEREILASIFPDEIEGALRRPLDNRRLLNRGV